ncbi:unnamed protein product [Paramecium pentaurelia]|uniref:RING-type E3 ubiquitin transferase n=1 Tax=Paramecium pentaurelia TaxID=43138 RepID=A0A8S1Y323_9CILI|nr:unnamed protein product [Paramecium pentaurelia]
MGNTTSNHPQITEVLTEYPFQHKNCRIASHSSQRKILKAASKQNELPHKSNRRFAPNIVKSLEFKSEGNHYIKIKQYKKAIESYTKAINLYNHDSIYFSNRSVANKLLNRFQEAKQDALQAILIDQYNSRAHFLYGTVILIEVQMFPDISEALIKQAQLGIEELEKAFEQVKQNKNEQKNKLKVLINQNLAKGKRMIYLIRQEIDKRNILSLKQTLTDIAHRQHHHLDWNQIDQIIHKKIEIILPECFVCPITYEIMNEPTLINSGLTYDKHSIQQQFKLNGYFDPMTRENIDPLGLIQNIQLQQGIQQIQQQYGWVGIENEKDYKAIKFE